MTSEVYEILVNAKGTAELLAMTRAATENARATTAAAKAAQNTVVPFRSMANAAEQTAEASRRSASAFQNVGFQVQDFATQVSGGTSALRAASQQLPQILGAFSFGPVFTIAAVAVGTLAAALPALIDAFGGGADAAEEFAAALKAFDQTADNLEATLQKAKRVQEAYAEAVKVGNAEAIEGLRKQAEGILVLQRLDQEREAAALRALQASLNSQKAEIAATEARIREQEAVLRAAKLAQDSLGGVDLQAVIDADIRKLEEQRTALEQTNAEYKIAEGRLQEMSVDAERTKLALQAVADDSGQTAEGLRESANSASAMADQLGRAAGVIAGILAQIGNVKFDTFGLQIETQFLRAGASLEEAAAAGQRAETSFRELADATKGLSSPDQIRGIVQTTTALQGQRAEAEAVNRAAKAARDALVESAKAAASAGGGGGAARSEAAKSEAEALKLVSRALEETRTESEKAAAKASELQAALDAVSASGVFTAAEIQRVQEFIHQMGKASEALKEVLDITESGLQGAFDSLIEGTTSVEQAFADMLVSILQDVARFLVSRQIQSLINLLGSQLGGLNTLFNTPVEPSAAALAAPVTTLAAANDNVRRATAPGATLAVVRQATPTPASQRGDVAPVSITVNNNNGSEVTTEERLQPDGTREIEIFIDNRVRSAFASGRMDKVLAQSYGLRRRPG